MKKRDIGCDQVFAILTRGPFPTGDRSDVFVESHLASCSECRTLAESLRPAADMFHESIDVDECTSLPGYQGMLPELDAHQTIATAVSRFQPRLKHSPARIANYAGDYWLVGWRIAGAVVIGATLMSLLWGMNVVESRLAAVEPAMVSASSDSASDSASGSTDKQYAPQASDRSILASVMRSYGCPIAPPAPYVATESAEPSGVVCCTSCHRADNRSSRVTPFHRLVASCRECHARAITTDR